MKQPENKVYSITHIFRRSMICNTAYFVFCAVFIVLIFQSNIDNSQDPTPLLFLICAVAALISCGFEMFLRDEQNIKFLPIARFWIFYGKILAFIVFEAVMVLLKNFLAVILTVTILPTLFLIGIYLIYVKYLKSADQIRLTIQYKFDETKKKCIGFTVMYFILASACIIWLVLEIVLGNKLADRISIERVSTSVILLIINLCFAIFNLIHAIKFNKKTQSEVKNEL